MVHGDIGPLARLRGSLLEAAREHFKSDGLLEVRVPTVVGPTGSCENAQSLMAVGSTGGLFLTQTGQLSLESLLDSFTGVWCHTASYRDDVVDARHLREFELIEEEVSTAHPSYATAASGDIEAMFAVLLARAERAVRAMVDHAAEECVSEIERLGGRANDLQDSITEPFPVVTYAEAIALLQADGVGEIAWGDDLGAADESRILALVAENVGRPVPVFVTRFPEQLKYFNMSPTPEASVVYSADLLLPVAGEAVGAAVRETDPVILTDRFNRLMRPSLATRVEDDKVIDAAFARYFEAARGKRLPRHAGFGIGLERLLQFVTGTGDIRSVSLLTSVG